MKRQVVGYVVVLGCALLACKMFKKDEPVVDAAAEPTPVAEAAAPEVDASAATTEDASADPAPANTTTVTIKKDAGVKDGGKTDSGVVDAGSTATVDAGGIKINDAGINPCIVSCNTTYGACLLLVAKKNADAAKCRTDRDACRAKCK